MDPKTTETIPDVNCPALRIGSATRKIVANRQMELMNAARSRASFDPHDLTAIIYGSHEEAQARSKAIARIHSLMGESNPSEGMTRKLPKIYGDLTRTDILHYGLQAGSHMSLDSLEYSHPHFDYVSYKYSLVNTSPFGLHRGMFIPTLKLLASAEQVKEWLPKAESGEWIGTYCQTELGHGTFVRGLETTATFNPSTDEIIIHSPTTSSTKYWPGGLGLCCSHAIVMAQLVVFGKSYGVHPFLVPLRSLEDFKPFPGIELGDIGLKMGMNTSDNGYAVFDHVRIPRTNMLMRHSTLSRSGVYTKSPYTELSYGTMTYLRNVIAWTSSFQLAQAATIAIRYSSVREQGSIDSQGKETTIMEYQSQRYRLLALMARSFALLFASQACDEVYRGLAARQSRGDYSTLPYCHMITATLKAYATQLTADGAEDARKCCGGHGYSALSGLPDIVANVTPLPTLEGENYVMYQQGARYLMKVANAVRKGATQVDTGMEYLVEGYKTYQAPHRPGSNFLDPKTQLELYNYRAARLVFEAAQMLEQSQHEGKTYEQAWNEHMLELISASRAHIELFALQAFHKLESTPNPALRRVLIMLRDLYALTTIESPYTPSAQSFLSTSSLPSPTANLRTIRSLINCLLNELVPEAVALTDAWNFSDESLSSALGRKDGNCYEAMLEWTRQLPINQMAREQGGRDEVGFERWIKPVLRASMRAKL